MGVFNDPKVLDANRRLEEKLTEWGGKLKLGFNQTAAGDPLPNPVSLTNLFAKLQTDLLDMRREQIVLGAAVRLMIEGLAGKDADGTFAAGMAEAMVTDIDRQLAKLQELIVEQKQQAMKPKIKLPPGFSGRN